MLRDIEDSKRVNFSILDYIKKNSLISNQQTDKSKDIFTKIANKQVEVILISEHYWPSLVSLQPGTESTNMKLHPDFLSIITSYNETYEKVRAPRKLNHLQTLGQVELTITTEDGKQRDVQVSPLQANILLFLSDESLSHTHSLQGLYMAMEVDDEEIAKAMRYWKNIGVVREIIKEDDDDIYYQVIEVAEENDLNSNNYFEMVIKFSFSLSLLLSYFFNYFLFFLGYT